jgi:hypothetical protein
MWKKIALVGASAAVMGGAGTAAFAASGTPTPAPSTSSVSPASGIVSSASTTKNARHPGLNRLRRTVHATWVTQNKKTKTFTTHDAIRGQVSAVSPTSITVQSADNLTQTYVITLHTKVHTRTFKGAASISDVKTGDPVFVGGTGTNTLTALRVVDTRK